MILFNENNSIMFTFYMLLCQGYIKKIVLISHSPKLINIEE